jgi:hypothetical protein
VVRSRTVPGPARGAGRRRSRKRTESAVGALPGG